MSQLSPPPPQPTRPSRPAGPTTRETPAAAGPTTQVLPARGVAAPEEGPTPISAQLPPPPATMPTGTAPTGTAPTGTAPTGPVGSVPGPPPPGATTVTRRRRDSGAVAGLVLGIAAVVLLQIGLLLDMGKPHSFWTTVPLWCGFATLASLVGLLASTAGRSRAGSDRAWRLSACGLTGLAVFWVLVVLPIGNTDRGFVFTAALGCLGASVWLAPGRRA